MNNNRKNIGNKLTDCSRHIQLGNFGVNKFDHVQERAGFKPKVNSLVPFDDYRLEEDYHLYLCL